MLKRFFRFNPQLLGAILTGVLASSPQHNFAQEQFPENVGYRSLNFGSEVYARPTAEKPEHKLWVVDYVWYGSLWDSSSARYAIHKFNPELQTWENTGVAIDDRGNTLSDALWDGKKLFVASHVRSGEGPARLYRFSYKNRSRKFVLDAGFPAQINENASETLSITKDGAGALWAVWMQDGRLMLNNAEDDGGTWGEPFEFNHPAAAASADDIAAIAQLNEREIGVMWSNQKEKTIFFATHATGAPREEWSAPETAFFDSSEGFAADDHINIKTSSRGELFAVIKTGMFKKGEPAVMLLHRSQNDGWQRHEVWKFEDGMTRPLMLIDGENQELYVLAVCHDCEDGSVYLKSSPIDAIRFSPGAGTLFLQSASDSALNDLTSTRQKLDGGTDLLVLASDAASKFYLHNVLDLPSNQRPFKPTALSAEAENSVLVQLFWRREGTNESGFKIERKKAGGRFSQVAEVGAKTTRFIDGNLTGNTNYIYRIRAFNHAGISGASQKVRVSTPPLPPRPESPAQLYAEPRGYSQIDLSWQDGSDNEDGFIVERRQNGEPFSEIARVSANVKNLSDAHLPASTSFEYQVYAFNLAGGSEPANVAAARTMDFTASDSTNIAVGKRTAASNKGHEKYMHTFAVDALDSTYWGVRNPKPGEWLSVDLDSPMRIGAVSIQWPSKFFAKAYDLQVSDDAENWSTIHSAAENSGGEHFILFPQKIARYVRVLTKSYNETAISITELGVYPETPPGFAKEISDESASLHVRDLPEHLKNNHPFATGREHLQNAARNLVAGQNNMAKNKPCSASGSDPRYGPEKGSDGDMTTYWRSLKISEGEPVWFMTDLGESGPLVQVAVKWKGGSYAATYALQISDDAKSWQTIEEIQKESMGFETFELQGKAARYVRLFMTAAKKSTYKLLELEVVGEEK